MNISKPIIGLELGDVPRDAIYISVFISGLTELFFIENPDLDKNDPMTGMRVGYFIEDKLDKFVRVYYPDRNILVKTLSEDLYFKLRTNRNRNLITELEQMNYRNMKIGIAGLSVGSGILHALVMSGGPKTIKIADFDFVEVGNLNRLRAGLCDVGSSKVEVAAREVWNLDPFADLDLWTSGLNKDNLHDFLLGKPRLDLFIDEMDDIELKVEARKICRANKIPVLMATDNGDSVILDIERFDLEPNMPIFHGLIREDTDLSGLREDRVRWMRIATGIISPALMTPLVQKSIMEIGRSIAGVPQLGTTALTAGSTVSFAVRRIANNQDMPSGRYIVSLEEKLIPGYMDNLSVEDRKNNTLEFIKAMKGSG